MLRLVFGTMIAFYIFIFWLGVPLAEFIFPWGGVAESHLKAVYLGIVALSGLIVWCTYYIAKFIEELKLDTKVNE